MPCPGCVEAALWLDELRREGKIELIGGTNFDTPQHAGDCSTPACRWRRCRCSTRCSTRGRSTAWSICCRDTASTCSATASVAGGFLGDRWLGRAGAAAALREPLAHQVQADHRRFRRLEPVPGTAAHAPPRSPTGTASISPPSPAAPMLDRPQVAAVIVGARNRAHLAGQPGDHGAAARRQRTTPRSTRCWRGAQGPAGDSYALERDRTGRHGAIMKYNLNTGHGLMPAELADTGGAGGRGAARILRRLVPARPGAGLSARCEGAFHPDFRMVTPEGRLLGRAEIIAWNPGRPWPAARHR